jgi:HEAT repeat protein
MTDEHPSNDLLPTTLARLGLGKGTLSPGAETQLEQLLTNLGSQEWSTRAHAARALGKLGERAPIEPLVNALQDENDSVRAAAAQALGTLSARVPLAPLIHALHDPSWRVRAAAVLALSRMGDRAPIDDFAALVDDGDASVCIAALQALGAMGERAPLEPLVLGLNDQDWTVREAAAMALGDLGQRAPADPLVAALQDKDSSVREAARRALQQTHPGRLLETVANSTTEPLSPEYASDTNTNHLTIDRERTAPLREPDPIGGNAAPVDQPTIHSDRSTFFVEPIPLRPRQHRVPRRQRISQRIVAIGAVALIAASLIIAALAALPRIFSPSPAPLALGIGGADFVSSQIDLVSQNTGLIGIDDELQINLHDLKAPASGKSYYGWLLGKEANIETNVIPLGRLPFSGGNIDYLYKNPTRQNLLATTSFFLITEEDSSVPPLVPTPDHSQWRYSAGISQTPDPADTVHHYSLFDHIQHLLAKDPTLESIGLNGGVGFWLVRNVGKVEGKVQTAQTYWKKQDAQQVRNQLIGMLDYLDGISYVLNDVPPGTPLEAPQQYAHIGLLQIDPQGYLEHIEFHLSAMAQNPDASSDQKALATRLVSEINKINAQCEMVHQDATILLHMTDAQLLQSSSLSLLNDMMAHAKFASNGGDQQVKLEGAVKVFNEIQGLASFDVEAYKQ